MRRGLTYLDTPLLPRRGQRSTAAAVAVAIAATMIPACNADDASEPETTVPATTTVPVEPRVNDGALLIGLLLPTDAPLVAEAIGQTAQQVVDEINDAGGVLGEQVDVQTAEAGSSAAASAAAVDELVEAGVDAIVGPITSTNAITVVDAASRSGVVTCSPTATAAILDDVPERTLFFRTIASDSLQAEAIAETVDNTGARSVTVAYVDDAYGRPYATAVTSGLKNRSLQVIEQVAFTPGEDIAGVVDQLIPNSADVLVALGAGTELATLLTALGDADPAAFDTVVTNDAVRSAANQAVLAALPYQLRTNITGVAPQIIDRRFDAEPVVFSPQVTDCVTLLALSTIEADSDAPELIAAQMAPVSSGGRLCRSFDACAQIAVDRQINYNGPTGVTELNRVGETSRAAFDRFTITDDGSDELSDIGGLTVSL